MLRARARLVSGVPGDLQPDGNVFERGLPGKQRVGLEQVAGLAIERRKRRAENIDAPDDGAISPAATLSSVDLPQPVGPTMATNSPSATLSVARSTAV